MKGVPALLLLVALCAAVTGCGSSHRVVGIGPHTLMKGFADCGLFQKVSENRTTHLRTIRTIERIPCTGYHPVGQASHAPYAYQLPIDPYHPENGQWSTLVRVRPVTVGYRLHGIFAGDWVVAAVKPLPQDGQPAAVRGWRGKQNPIWHGKLVLRPAD